MGSCIVAIGREGAGGGGGAEHCRGPRLLGATVDTSGTQLPEVSAGLGHGEGGGVFAESVLVTLSFL